MMSSGPRVPNVLLVGTGEYTTGIVAGGTQSKSDKRIGVVGLSFFELRRLGQVGKRIVLCGTNGTKFPIIREHFATNISAKYAGLDCSFQGFPEDGVEREALAYERAIASMEAGDLCVIFTPDDTHFAIAEKALLRGLHVLVTKPMVHTLEQHARLVELAQKGKLVLATEVHKRWDPMYSDARHRIRQELAPLSYFHALMTQPAFQLQTFRSWAGSASDISYYLNSHHVDFLNWCLHGLARPVAVSACGARGFADSKERNFPPGTCDSITLSVTYQHKALNDQGLPVTGCAVFTASWIAPESDVHTQQGFLFLGHGGQAAVDQGRRGYTVASGQGLKSVNPLYMKYSPGPDGHFDGHNGYGFRTFVAFVSASVQVQFGGKSLEDVAPSLAMGRDTLATTAILEAGARSLKHNGKSCAITYEDSDWNTPIGLQVN